MADYPTTPAQASTSAHQVPQTEPHTPAHASPDPHHIAQLLAALAQVSREELPDGEDRGVLEALIHIGFVDNLYTPIGEQWHNIAWTHRPPWMDPRERIADWLAARRAWEQTGELAGKREQLAARDE